MNAAIAREEEKVLPRLRSLYEIAKAFNSSLDLKETCGEVLGILSRHMGMKRGAFLVMNTESNEWEMGGAHGLSAEEMKRRKEYFGSGVMQRILEKAQMAAVVDGGETIWLYEGKTKQTTNGYSQKYPGDQTQVSGECTPLQGPLCGGHNSPLFGKNAGKQIMKEQALAGSRQHFPLLYKPKRV